jgi:hypothetical protein
MKLVLKDEYKDKVIFLALEKRDIIAKFIDVRLYDYLYKLYPEMFRVVKERKVIKVDIEETDWSKFKNKDKNDKNISDTE